MWVILRRYIFALLILSNSGIYSEVGDSSELPIPLEGFWFEGRANFDYRILHIAPNTLWFPFIKTQQHNENLKIQSPYLITFKGDFAMGYRDFRLGTKYNTDRWQRDRIQVLSAELGIPENLVSYSDEIMANLMWKRIITEVDYWHMFGGRYDTPGGKKGAIQSDLTRIFVGITETGSAAKAKYGLLYQRLNEPLFYFSGSNEKIQDEVLRLYSFWGEVTYPLGEFFYFAYQINIGGGNLQSTFLQKSYTVLALSQGLTLGFRRYFDSASESDRSRKSFSMYVRHAGILGAAPNLEGEVLESNILNKYKATVPQTYFTEISIAIDYSYHF